MLEGRLAHPRAGGSDGANVFRSPGTPLHDSARAAARRGNGPMNTARESSPNPPRTLPEAVVRTLRHEVGDLLQTVYAAAAVLQQRLPEAWDLERRILADMRARGDACKGLIDITHDLICPVAMNLEAVNLAELLVHATADAAARRPDVKLETELADT